MSTSTIASYRPPSFTELVKRAIGQDTLATRQLGDELDLALRLLSQQTAAVANAIGLSVNAPAGSNASISTSIPSQDVIVMNQVVAPSTPPAGKTNLWADATDKNVHALDDAGNVSVTVRPLAILAHNFLTSISSKGAVTQAQPAFGDLSGSIVLAQTLLTTRGDLLTVDVTPALVRLGIGATSTVLHGATGGDLGWANVSVADAGANAHGNSTKYQISDGTGTSGNLSKYDANGNVTDGGGPPAATIAALAHNFLTSYTATTGAFTKAQPAATDLSDGTTGSGTVVLATSPALTTPTIGGGTAISTSDQVAATIATSGRGYAIPGAGAAIPSNTTGSAIISANNQVRVVQFMVPFRTTINKITTRVTTAVAASTIDAGVYAADGNTKLLSQGGLSGATTGYKTTTLGAPVTLLPGVPYVYAYTSSDSTIQLEIISNGSANGMLNSVNIRAGTAANAATAGVLPATLGAITPAAVNTVLSVLEP